MLRIKDRAKCGKVTELYGEGHRTEKFVLDGVVIVVVADVDDFVVDTSNQPSKFG